MADELINIKIEPHGGFGLSIGGKLPELFYKLLPAKYRLRRDIDETIHKNIVEKIGANTELTDGEKEFIEVILSDRAAKALRLNRVLANSCEVLNEKGPLKLGAATEGLGHSDVIDSNC